MEWTHAIAPSATIVVVVAKSASFLNLLDAVDYAFGGAVDYAMLVKLYGETPAEEARYSPAKCIGTRTESEPARCRAVPLSDGRGPRCARASRCAELFE